MYFKNRLSKVVLTSLVAILGNSFLRGNSKTTSKCIEKESVSITDVKGSFLFDVQNSVTGQITDETGAPLPGASVMEKGTTNGTITDFDGNYVINVAQGATLQISYLGYTPKEITVGNNNTIDVQLEPDATQLDDVVVIGYGTQKRSDVTGAIASVKSEDFNKGVVTNPGELLQGKMAGVNITANSGEPGASQNVIIRGIGSLRSGTQPLYVVDGFLLDNSSNGVATNPLNFLNPSDIASIDVLKDASATAVYGSRASNGVVVITTKRGRAGKTEMNLSLSTAASSMSNKINVFDADEFRNQVVATGGSLDDYGGNTNWQDELSQTGITNNLNLSMSGAGSEKFNYFASLGYQDQEGILKNSNLERYSGKLNMTQKAFNGKVNIDYNLTASHTENLRPDIRPIISDMLALNPTVPTYTNGEPTLLNTNALNPIARYNIFSDQAVNNRILATISPSVEIIKGLTYKLNFGIDYSATTRDRQYKPYTSVVNESDISNGDVVTTISSNSNQLTENTLTYNWNRDVHNLSVLAGHSYQKFMDETRLISYRGFADNNIEPIYQDQTSSDTYPTSVNSSAVKNELQSYFGRVNYGYDNRYLLTATFRADGSSKFGDNRKYGYFPSFALGWNISNENFMADSFFDNLKLRASWGQTGNQEIPSKITKASYSEDRLISGGESLNTYPIDTDATSIDGYPYGIVYTRLANPDLQWEVSTSVGVGIDFALLNYRLSGTLDYFNKQSSNILLEVVPADPVEPTPTYWSNIDNMKIQNNGIELALDYSSDATRDFSYNIGGNITYIQNKVKDSPYSVLTTGSAQGSGQTGATINGYINGEPIGSFYMFQFEGIESDGLNQFKDINGDGAILDDDRSVVGSAIPKFTYAYYLNFKYKAFDLGLNFNGVSGNKIYNHTKMSLFTKAQLSRSNNTTDFAIQYPNESTSNSNTVSTRYLENGSFLRLNNATLAYNLSAENIGLGDFVQNIRFSITGQNLFTITDYSGFDPEVNTGSTSGGIQTFGVDYFTYPKARTFLVGLNLTF
ncbi:SusC/RagA family TonB-linked outer membrane protein [Maribacter cobaltidurans]|uniref:SusC/RagA family TonB-linked outer membrane protein n=1 Tax=Maribacter cobaltidurans TaxID=1178778 RepID=A0A223V2X1_9FLAO|nr:TonB-dependent receptor [Maribacter cobaltidurans]ASV29754.1 SusC/RagA family TonB-linked outer membrane protein [Maribacter cobaltidurans]GGD92830.1 SusC/RagA family TonB-linked outer membrane protein [Maribacter cobaltidurans]